MKQNHFDSSFSAYLDGELESRENNAISQHLSGCPECQKRLAVLKRVRSDSSKLGHYQINPFFAQRILAEYKSHRQESFWNSLALIPRAIVQGAIAIAVAILLLLLWPQPTHRPSESNIPLTIEYRIILDGDWAVQALETNDQALTFALNQNGEAAK